MIEDGTYDVFVVDVITRDDDERAATLELAITTGARKGEVIAVRASAIDDDAIALIGLPGALTVADGEPHVVFER